MYGKLLPDRLKTLREGRGTTKRGLAAAAKVSATTAGNAERGLPVRSKTARKVAAALGVDPPQRRSARQPKEYQPSQGPSGSRPFLGPLHLTLHLSFTRCRCGAGAR